MADDEPVTRMRRVSERTEGAAERVAALHERAAALLELHADIAESIEETVGESHRARERAARLRHAVRLDRGVARQEEELADRLGEERPSPDGFTADPRLRGPARRAAAEPRWAGGRLGVLGERGTPGRPWWDLAS